jgi:hypothetical protein
MSALSVVYTKAGFVLAADGKASSTDGSISALTTDYARKIFKARYKRIEFAWAITEIIYNPDKSFDLLSEVTDAIGALVSVKFKPIGDCVRDVAARTNASIRKAHADGVINEYPYNPDSPDKDTIAHVFLAGYFRRLSPSLIRVRFHHKDQILADPQILTEEPPANDIYSGSHAIAQRYCTGLPEDRFGKYFRPSGPLIEHGIAHAVGFIEACKDPMASHFDPNCRNIGGRIHAASVTPRDGFRWVPGYEPSSPET